MKNILAFFLITMIYGSANANICEHDHLILNDFEDYRKEILAPSCDTISGDLTCQYGFFDYISGSWAPKLKAVMGNVTILGTSTYSLVFESELFKFIGGDLIIDSNWQIYLESFRTVKHIGGDLIIKNNFTLTDLAVFDSLTYIGGSLTIEGNDDLQIIGNILHNTQINGDIIIRNNPNLQSIGGLNMFEPSSINSLTISNCPALSICNLPNFCKFLETNTNYTIENNAPGCNNAIEVLSACSITCPEEDVFITTDIDALNFHGTYNGCDTIQHNIYISISEASMFDAYEFPVLEVIQGDLIISDVSGIGGIIGFLFSNLKRIDGDLIFLNNQFNSINIFCPNLESIGGDFVFEGHSLGSPTSTFLQTPFSSLQTIEGNYIYRNNIGLGHVLRIQSLENIFGNFVLENNPNMTILNAFDNIGFVGGEIQIKNNNDLANVNVLYKIDSNSFNNLVIQNNPMLSYCQLVNFCEHIEQGGPATISGNNTNCNSVQDLTNACGSSAGCFISGYNIQSNIDIDVFLATYPNCNKINGDLFITDITSLEGLENIDTIMGSLVINSSQLENFSGLQNLSYIGSGISMQGNFVQEFKGLEKLTSLDGNFVLNSNTILSLNGFNNLNSISGAMEITNVTQLQSLEGLENLNSIGGNLIITGNGFLENIDDFENLVFLNGDLEIGFNANMTAINFPSLQVLEGNLNIVSNSVQQIDLGNSMTHVGALSILDNSLLQTISGGNNLFALGNFEVKNNPALSSIISLNIVNTLDGNLTVQDCPNLQTFKGFDSLQSITGSVTFSKLPSFTDCSAFHQVTSVGSFVTFFEIPEFLDSDQFSLQNIGGSLLVSKTAFSDLQLLQNLLSVNSTLEITNNQQLENIDGLSNLGSINGFLAIFNNDLLQNLNGINNLSPGSIDNLYFYGNNLLEECAVYSVCAYLSEEENLYSLNNNQSGCNTREEILEQCITDVSTNNPENKIRLYPNPANEVLYLASDLRPLSYRLYTTTGQLLSDSNFDEMTSGIRVGHLQAGIYLLQLNFEEGDEWLKFVKN